MRLPPSLALCALLLATVAHSQASPAASSHPATAFTSDHTFDAGSHLTLATLTPLQVSNLVLLGRVWGFLKYHHPAIAAGQRQWDYDLLRELPAILAAGDRSTAEAELVRWITALGPVPPCKACARAPAPDLSLALAPDLAWINDPERLGARLSHGLESIRAARPTSAQFYVSLYPKVGNPVFEHELAYPNLNFPDPGFQLLALFRLWNIIQYWSPYRVVDAEDWPVVLEDFIPRIALARSKDDYTVAMLAFVATVNDTHTNLWGALDHRPPLGGCRLPVNVRFVGVDAVVTTPATGTPDSSSDLHPGDILQSIDGHPVPDLVRAWSPFYAASNQPTRLRDIARTMTNGACGSVPLQILRDGRPRALAATRMPIKNMDRISFTHDLPGPAFRLLSPEVAYLKLSSIKAADISGYLQKAASAKGLIVDIRNYPSEFVPFALGSHLVTRSTPFATFTHADLANPGAFVWGETEAIDPIPPNFGGKVVILVDETSLSQAEYTAMALRAAPGALVLGSTTAGADGNVSRIPLPGDLFTLISGIGVFYPDRRPTQRVGIIPDIEVLPTLSGLRDGRDEILERAIREILGAATTDDQLRQLANPPAR